MSVERTVDMQRKSITRRVMQCKPRPLQADHGVIQPKSEALESEHCKRDGHTKERCWILNPSIKFMPSSSEPCPWRFKRSARISCLYTREVIHVTRHQPRM
ncbi:hypothetical protein YC2023_094293 [Brassica napus]